MTPHENDACREAWVDWSGHNAIPERLRHVFEAGWTSRAAYRAPLPVPTREQMRGVPPGPSPYDTEAYTPYQDATQTCARCQRPRRLRELVCAPPVCKDPCTQAAVAAPESKS